MKSLLAGKAQSFPSALLRWYDTHRRILPWRERPSPYRTWISEIMLQQTQVATVLPYYDRFLRRFPDVRSLAKASEREVLRLWAGLGYYSRARNLHRASKLIATKYNGSFPSDPEQVLELPGIGRYTLGAILSIAFGKPLPVLDGNVARVLTRFFGIRGDVKSGETQKTLWALAERLLEPSPEKKYAPNPKDGVPCARPGDWNQALMELGALVCVPESPHCDRCPITGGCVARRRGLQDELPESKPSRAAVSLQWTCLWIEKSGRLLLWKRENSERFLPGHWGLPEPRHISTNRLSLHNGHARYQPMLMEIRHTITYHKITVAVHRAESPIPPLPKNAQWVPITQIRKYLVSSIWLKALDRLSEGSRESL